MHAHPWPQLLYAQSGAVCAAIAERIWILPPRQGLWIPAHTSYRLHMSSRLLLRTLYLRPDTRRDEVLSACIVSVSGLLHEAILRVCAQGALDDRIEVDRCLATLVRAEIDVTELARFALLQPGDQRAQRLADLFFSQAFVGVPLEALCA